MVPCMWECQRGSMTNVLLDLFLSLHLLFPVYDVRTYTASEIYVCIMYRDERAGKEIHK